MLQIFNRILGFNLYSHGDPVQTLITQGNLHIIPPIKIFEGFEDYGCQCCWIIHLIASRTTNSSKKYLNAPAKTLQNTSIHNQTNSNTPHFDMCTFFGCITPGYTSLDIIQREQGKNTKNYVEPNCLWCINGSLWGLKLAWILALIPCLILWSWILKPKWNLIWNKIAEDKEAI